MNDLSKEIFGNPVSNKDYKKACKSKKKFIKKFGDDSKTTYHLKPVENETLGKTMGIDNLVLSDEPLKLDDNAVIIGNIRMGFGHYRISIAMASCANALGYKPYWFDLNSFTTSTAGKMINYQNQLYSKGSRISQKSKIFNKVVWEPLNSEGFKKITYNSSDQKNSELLVPLYQDFNKDVPFVATHVWPSQGAIHAGLNNVCNAIPDNWPMGLHLSEGAIHTVQTPFAFLGYKKLNKMAKNDLKPMPQNTLYNVGHYIDHELVSNLEEDTKRRVDRLENGKTLRMLLTVGGAGAQYDLFKRIIKYLTPYIEEKKVCLFVNFGDHLNVYDKLCKDLPYLNNANKYFDEWDKVLSTVETLKNGSLEGIHLIYNKDIFKAVYSTNLLMRETDVLITKPSELAYYPVPKLMIQRVGGHEAYGAIHASEIGDGTFECSTIEDIESMLQLLINDNEVLLEMNKNIKKMNELGMYNGGYEVIKLVTKK